MSVVIVYEKPPLRSTYQWLSAHPTYAQAHAATASLFGQGGFEYEIVKVDIDLPSEMSAVQIAALRNKAVRYMVGESRNENPKNKTQEEK